MSTQGNKGFEGSENNKQKATRRGGKIKTAE